MGRFPGNFGRPRLIMSEIAQKNEVFFQKNNALKCHISAADLRKIWKQYVNRYRHQSFQKRIAKTFTSLPSITDF